MDKLNAWQLRNSAPLPLAKKKIKKTPIYIILDNVLDTYNVGSIFRLADAVAARKIYLCGETETPPNTKIKKASINTWQWVDWEYQETALKAVSNLKSQISNLKVIAIEQNEASISFFDYKPEFPLCLVVGNESFGVSAEVLRLADKIVELPMYGINKSLNAMVCSGIVLYKLMEHLNFCKK